MSLSVLKGILRIDFQKALPLFSRGAKTSCGVTIELGVLILYFMICQEKSLFAFVQIDKIVIYYYMRLELCSQYLIKELGIPFNRMILFRKVICMLYLFTRSSWDSGWLFSFRMSPICKMTWLPIKGLFISSDVTVLI